jgi:cytochrome c oxidase subunit 4
MSTTSEEHASEEHASVVPVEDAGWSSAGGADSHHPSDIFYVKIAVALCALTALEVSTYYVSFGPIFLPLLLTVMFVKFTMVVLFFMHLRFDAKIFGQLFWAGFILAVAVYSGALATFHFFAAH